VTLLGLLAGCGGLGLDLVEAESDGAGSLRIDAISPDWGPPDGGTEVTITGVGFDASAEVSFGNAALDVTRIDAETILVVTPDAGTEITVDVTVRAGGEEVVLEDGFAFAEEPPPDDTDDDSGSGGGGGSDDGVGALVEFSLLQIACPSCFGVTSDLDIYANAAFHAPTTRRNWTGWLPSSGTCAIDPSQEVPEGPYLDAGDWAYLNAGSRSIGMRATTSTDGTTYLAEGLQESQYARNSGYDLSVTGGSDVDAFDVDDVLLTPQGFSTVTPQELLYTQASQAFTARVSRSGQTFTWSPSGGDGTFVILVSVYSENGAALLGNVVCRDTDDGSMTIPSTYLGSFPRNALLAVSLFRYQSGHFALPSGATGESLATVGVLGTGVLQ
jgi:hypothetical protein